MCSLINHVTDSLSTGVVTAVICCVVSIVITAITITAHCYKRKYTIKSSLPDNNMTTDPSYDVAMTSNPAYGHNVKKIDEAYASDYY